jgi:hypothetical protein
VDVELSVNNEGDILAIVIRLQNLDTYILPKDLDCPPLAAPLDVHYWSWGTIYSCCCAQDLNSLSSVNPLPDYNILARFSLYYPWPAGMIHHYRLRAERQVVDGKDRWLYKATPQRITSIPCTSDPFGDRALAIGNFGRALWADSTGRGRVIKSTRLLSAPSLASRGGSLASEREKVNPDTILLRLQPEDSWLRSMAIDEASGRIALGFENGTLSVFDCTPS